MSDWQDVEDELLGVVRTRHTLFTVAGTWAPWDAGFQADVARRVDPALFKWQPVGYDASFGPVPPGDPAAPSYEESVAGGVAETVRLINATPGTFGLVGYSQGAEVVRRVELELAAGSLTHRLKDCLWVVTFGDPARQPDDLTFGGGKGAGISRLVIPRSSISRITYAIPGDMYCTTPWRGQDGDIIHAFYSVLIQMQIHDMGDFFTKMLTGLMGGDQSILGQVQKILGAPIQGGIAAVQALILVFQLAAHGRYDDPGAPADKQTMRTCVQHAVDYLNYWGRTMLPLAK